MYETTTERGFKSYGFEDRYGNKCSLQKSSLATEDCIWLGCNLIDLKVMGEKGWEDVDLNGRTYVANNRMHLSQENVKMLLPFLIKFAETGEI